MAVERRSDQKWLDDLSGKRGADKQSAAFDDLSRYLYVVSYNYLRIKRQNRAALAKLSDNDLAKKAEDFVQEVLERIALNDFHLLSSYKGIGRFTSYMAVIAKRHIDRRTDKKEYAEYPLARLTADEDDGDDILEYIPLDETGDLSPETATLREHFVSVLRECLNKLSDLQRRVFLAREFGGLSSRDIAAALGKSVGAIHQNYRYARTGLATCLLKNGVDTEFLAAA